MFSVLYAITKSISQARKKVKVSRSARAAGVA